MKDLGSKRIRQDRYEIEDLTCRLLVNGESHRVINYSAFGIAIEAKSEFDKEKEFEGSLHIEDVEICKVNLSVVRNEIFDKGFRTAFETVGNAINTDRVDMVCNALKALGNIKAKTDRFNQLPDQFRLIVFELKDTLQKIEVQVKDFSTNQKVLSSADRQSFEKAVIDVMSGPIHNVIRESNLRLNALIENEGKEAMKLGFDFFREQLNDLIYHSPFADRSFKKPLGYAGDFEMMNLIYRNEDFGLSLFGRCMERAMQMHLEPGAVRNRSVYMREKIHKAIESSFPNSLKILSVASGPAIEVVQVVSELTAEECERVEFFLLDQDVLSLKSAQRSILSAAKAQGKKVNVTLLNKPIRQVISEGLGEAKFDLIYSAGLFDYFTDAVARRAAEVIVESLNSGGELIIGNFADTTPNRFGMLTLFDWYLILRSEENLRQLYSFEGLELSIESEPNGVNLFCVLQRA